MVVVLVIYQTSSQYLVGIPVVIRVRGAKAMNRAQLLRVLTSRLSEIQSRFAVRRLRLFGSAALDRRREDSDIDVLVDFAGPATFDQYMGLKFYLEDLLGVAVDLVSEKGLRPEFRSTVERESVLVA